MLLKISLIVAAVAAAATLAISQLSLAGKITEQKATLDATQSELTTCQTSLEASKKEATKFKSDAEKFAKDLAETSDRLEQQTARATSQQQRADRNETDLNKTRTELTDAQRELAAWNALTIPVDQVRNRLADLTKANDAIAALSDEKKVMVRQINFLKDRVARYEGDKEVIPDLPKNIKGEIVAVEPKWDFVVLNIGSDKELVPRAQLLVSRNGKLVAKLRIVTVEPNRAIANILPEWKQAEVRVGDVVMN